MDADTEQPSVGIPVGSTVGEAVGARPALSRWTAWLPACAVFLIVVSRNWPLVGRAVFEDGDFAANSLLIDRAKRLRLLTGNYSRVGFHHPGPALLWIQAAGEVVFKDVLGLVDTPYNGHVLSIVLLEVFSFLVSLLIARRWFSTVPAMWAMTVAMFAVISFRGGVQASTWMPHIYIWPFLLFTVATISLLEGELADVWAFVLAAVLLVHGHVSFLTNVAVTTAVVVAVNGLRWRRRSDRLRLPSRTVSVITLLIVLVGLAPMIANLVLHYPGDWKNYWTFSRSNAGGNPLRGSLRLMFSVWNSSARIGLAIAVGTAVAMSVLWLRSGLRQRQVLAAATGTFLLFTATVLFYVIRGVDDLSFSYVVIYYVSVPMVAAGLLLANLVDRVTWPSLQRVVAVGLAAGLAWIAGGSGVENPYRGAGWLPDASAALDAADEPKSPVVLQFETPGWPAALGVLEYQRRTGSAVCVANPTWAFLATAAEICTPEELRDGLSVHVDGSAPAPDGSQRGDTVFENPSVRISQEP